MDGRLLEVQQDVARLIGVGEWLPSTRRGDTGVGKAIEDALGIIENNLQEADFKGTEFKAKRQDSGALLTMFTRNPTTPNRAVHELVGRYGYDEDEFGSKRFNTNFAVGRQTSLGGSVISLACDDDRSVHVTADGEVVASWSYETLATSFMRKAKTIALIDVETKIIADVEHFRISSCSLHWDLDFDNFIPLVLSADISVHFRVKGNAKRAKNRGCAFRIEKSKLNKLYGKSLIIG